jgi:hypothetical protein
VTRFVRSNGIDVLPNAATLMHSTISASCTSSARAWRLTQTKDCNGCDERRLKETRAPFDYSLIYIAMAYTVFPPTQWKLTCGRRGTERRTSIDHGYQIGA